MKFTLSWLKEHLDTDADLDTIAETLTAIGLEVESVENPGAKLADFTIARVVSAEKHPNADKLQLLRVDAGSGETIQVVCGAPNAREGLVGVFAAPGTYVPGIDTTLGAAKIRDVESFGMMCSPRELELSDEHEGIIELAEEAPVGENYAEWAGLTDPVIDVSITPNRQDCMGVRGIARDLAAAGLGRLKTLAEAYEPVGAEPAGDARGGVGQRIEIAPIAGEGAPSIEIRTDDPEGCPAFYGRTMAGVTNGASPGWMAKRLRAIGQKPISALVDITNFVMIDLGRPLHVYDRARLGEAIFARRAEDGEKILALNGKEYELTSEMTVIADEKGIHDIGGIMGGEETGVQPGTNEIVIECAYFDPARIARTGQKLGLMSDARARFERGVDPAFLDDGLTIATLLVQALCGGKASAVTRAGAPPKLERTISYEPERCGSLSGMAVKDDRQAEILTALGFGVERGEPWRISVPSWRRDAEGPADIVEEVIRIEGYDRLPSAPLPRAPGVARPTATRAQRMQRRLRRAAAARGLNEAITWSFISETEAEAFGGSAWVLANPISEEMKAMRPSLLPGLLSAAARNMARGAQSVRLFEIGRRYLGEEEHPTLGLVLAGDARPRHWLGGKAQGFSAWDAKAEALALLEAAGAPTGNLMLLGDAPAAYHPGQSGRLGLGPKTILAAFGALHPALAERFDIGGPVAAAEIFLDAIPERRDTGRMRSAYAPPALQPVRRDFSFIMPEDVAAGDLLRAVRGADKKEIAEVRLFDIFTGEGVPEGHKSVAIEVVLQPTGESYGEETLKAISGRIVAAAEKLGGTLRS